MREREFDDFRRNLLRAGIAPSVAERVTDELHDHFADLVAELQAGGADPDTARRSAADALGDLEDVIDSMSARRELKTWAYRYPYAALVLYPLACLAALPAAPVVAGVAHATLLARWGASLLAAGVLTAGILLLLQLSILFG